MLSLTAIAAANAPTRLCPIAQLGAAHALTRSDIRMLTKFFGLQSVALNPASHEGMCASALLNLVAQQPQLRGQKGQIIYTKTQTHNTPADGGWLHHAAVAAGLLGWEVVTLSMNHCAGALSALHLVRMTAPAGPVIVLAGEKCFHPTTANQSGAALGEMPVAALIAQGGAWSVTDTRVTHAPAYYANPGHMDPLLLKQFAQGFGGMLKAFVAETLAQFAVTAGDIDLVVPYNLNLPTLREIAAEQGWEGKMILQTAPQIGHLFCADVLANLAIALPQSQAKTVFCFAAGMGATFAGVLLRKGTGSEISTSSIVFEGENGREDLQIGLTSTQDFAA